MRQYTWIYLAFANTALNVLLMRYARLQDGVAATGIPLTITFIPSSIDIDSNSFFAFVSFSIHILIDVAFPPIDLLQCDSILSAKARVVLPKKAMCWL